MGFACLNLVAMLVLITDDGPHGWETVPFHLIYVSFTLLYGYRMWRARGTIAGITFVSLSAGGMTLLAVHRSREDWAELTEVPLMGLMFLAMVYHVRRRQDAVAESDRLAVEPAGVAAAAARLRVQRVARAADADHDRARPHRPAQPLPQRRPRRDRRHQRHGGGRAGADGAADRPAAADRGRSHAGLPAAGRDAPGAVHRRAVPALAGGGAARVVAGCDPRHRGGGRPRPAGDLAGRAAGERDPPHRRRATASASKPSSWPTRCC